MIEDSYSGEQESRDGTPLPGVERSPVVTWGLLATNGLIWLAVAAVGGTEDPEVLLDFGAMFGPLIANGEYWRLFTAMFLHFGLPHLALNGFGLYIFGPLVEKTFGHVRFLTIYILAGLSGSVASFLFNSISVGVGASGAIFGVLGALAAFFVVQRRVLGRLGQRNLTGLLVLAGINLVFGWVTPGIDNAAHIGGLAAGFALGLALAPQYRMLRTPFGIVVRPGALHFPVAGWWAIPGVAAVLVLGTWLAVVTLPDNPYSRIVLAERYFESRDYNQAIDEVDAALRLDPQWAEASYLRGKILAGLGDLAEARAELSRAIKFGDNQIRAKAINLLVALDSGR